MSSFAIVPAAGRSRRMGSSKLLLPWGQGTVLEATLAAWRAGGVDETLVVIAPDADHGDAVSQLVSQSGATLVVPDISPPDMRASIMAALEVVECSRAPDASDCWLVAPADLPQLSATAIARVLGAHDPSCPRAVRAVFGDRHGHPVLLPWSWVSRWRGLPTQWGLNSLVREGPTWDVPCGDDAFQAADMDTADDYRRLRERYDRQN